MDRQANLVGLVSTRRTDWMSISVSEVTHWRAGKVQRIADIENAGAPLEAALPQMFIETQ